MRSASTTAAWRYAAKEAREHPAQWVLVSDSIAHATATHINQGRITAFRPAGDYQAMIRGGGEGGRGPLYVKYDPNSNPQRQDTA